jgi:hypothetical protein
MCSGPVFQGESIGDVKNAKYIPDLGKNMPFMVFNCSAENFLPLRLNLNNIIIISFGPSYASVGQVIWRFGGGSGQGMAYYLHFFA